MIASSPTLRALTMALPEETAFAIGLGTVHPGTLGPLIGTRDAHVWIRHGRGLIGFGEVARFSASGPERFQELRDQFFSACSQPESEEKSPEATGVLAMVKIAYSKRSKVPSELIVPRLVLSYPEHSSLVAHGPQLTLISAEADEVLSEEKAIGELLEATKHKEAPRLRNADDQLRSGSLTPGQWRDAVGRAVEIIEAKEVTKVVMARDIIFESVHPISRSDLARRLARSYDDCWTYSVDGLIGATPEMLIKLSDGVAQARVLAGTIDRSSAPPQTSIDDARQQLLSDPKQVHEHRLAIDSLIQALSAFAPELTHEREPFVLELPNVWHLASDVSVKLPERRQTPASLLDLAAEVHPTAAVCGTPRDVASLLIKELECMERGHYAGPVGWIDAAGNGELGIALRGTWVTSEHRARIFAGCGIVAGSVPEDELRESWAKMRPVLDALEIRAEDLKEQKTR